MDDPTLQIIAYTLIGTTAGYVLGRLDNGHRLTVPPKGATLQPRTSRPHYAFAREDIVLTPPAWQATAARLVIDEMGGNVEGRHLTFYVTDTSTNIRRDVTLSARQVLKFFKSGDDGPSRTGYGGNNNDYKLLLAVARCYGWAVEREGKPGCDWSFAFLTRERRIRALEMWLSRG